MKLTDIYFVLLLSVNCFVSCTKPLPEPEIEVDYFNKLKVQGSVNVYLVQGTTNDVISTTLDQTNFHDQSNSTLFIQSGTGSVTISVSNLSYIWCQGCNIHVEEQVYLPFLEMDLYSGDLNISNLLTDSLDIYTTGSDILEIAGSSTKADISLSAGSSLSAYNLICDTLEISTMDGNAEVHSTSFLRAFVNSNGNIIYKGNPDSVFVGGLGSGTVSPY